MPDDIKERTRYNKKDALVDVSQLSAGLAFSTTCIPWLGELIKFAIDQCYTSSQTDRIIECVHKLEVRLRAVEGQINVPLSDDYITMIEDAINVAKRAHTSERIKNVACLLASCLTDQRLDIINKEKLIRTFSELSDPEIILLNFYHMKKRHSVDVQPATQFAERHRDLILGPSDRPPHGDSPRKAYLGFRMSQDAKLVQLGLVRSNRGSVGLSGSDNPDACEITEFGELFIETLMAPQE